MRWTVVMQAAEATTEPPVLLGEGAVSVHDDTNLIQVAWHVLQDAAQSAMENYYKQQDPNHSKF